RVNDFTTNTWNRFTQGIDKAKTSISQITWAGFVQKMDNAKTSVKNFGSNTWTGFTARIDAIKNSASNALIPVKALFDENQVVRQTARREIAAIRAVNPVQMLEPKFFTEVFALSIFCTKPAQVICDIEVLALSIPWVNLFHVLVVKSLTLSFTSLMP
ncbi:MAG: hypothetical protein ACKPDM_03045, partial [Dolichospermum sp.]